MRSGKDAEDSRREAIKRKEKDREVTRIKTIQDKITKMSDCVPTTPCNSKSLEEIIMNINGIIIEVENFQELVDQAAQAKESALSRLNILLADRMQWEEEEEGRQKEIAELNRAKEENERLEAKRRAREEVERQKREAEAEDLRIERAAIEAEKMQIEADKRIIEKAREKEKQRQKDEYNRLNQIREFELREIGVTLPSFDPGAIPQDEYAKMYAKYKAKWDKKQEELRLKAEEKAKQERIEFERIAKETAEKDAREKLEQEGADRKTKIEADEVERKRLELLAPDKIKLEMLIESIKDVKIPDVVSKEAKIIVSEFKNNFDKTIVSVSNMVN